MTFAGAARSIKTRISCSWRFGVDQLFRLYRFRWFWHPLGV